MVKVSFIIPVYNVEKYLTECLESVTNQTMQEIEIICVEDQSRDNSLEILRNYSKLDNRIIIIQNPVNRGLSYSRNRGIEKASGEYIFFLDSDDMITPETAYDLYMKANENRLDMLHFNCLTIYEESTLEEFIGKYETKHKFNYDSILTGKQFFSECMLKDDYDTCAWRILYSREFILKNNLTFYDGIIHEDNLFVFLCYMNAEKVAYYNKEYYIYRRRQDSITVANNWASKIRSLIIIYFEIMSYWQLSDTDEYLDKAIQKLMDSIYIAILSKYRSETNRNVNLVLSGLNKEKKYFFTRFVMGEVGSPGNQNLIDKGELIKDNKIVIYGAGNIGRQILIELDQYSTEVLCFMVESGRPNVSYILGHKVLSIDEVKADYQPPYKVVVAVKNNTEEIVTDLKAQGFNDVISYYDL